jgi:GNAT superfamily N-acetyltransferase
MIRYTDTIEGLTPANLVGFFVGWPNPPTPETHLEILRGSDEVVLAVDGETGNVVGFSSAVTDGVLASYIPLLEVLPRHRGKGIGRELVRRMLAKLDGFYMIDIACDRELVPFYTPFGLRPAHAMVIRNYDRQSGRAGREQERP